MKRVWITLLLTLVLLGSRAAAWNGDGTVLVRELLPEGWILEMDYLASPSEVQMFSAQLGTTIELVRNYVFLTPEGKFQVNFVVTETIEEAEALYGLFCSIHADGMVALNGRRVLEVVTENPALVEVGRAFLKFVSEETESRSCTALKNYLEKNSWSIANLADITLPLQSELNDYHIFLVGESHGVAVNQQLESILLEFFVTQGGVRNYLLELSPSVVGYLREYVETGNEAVLDRVFDSVKGTYFWTKENYEHWKNVRTLWESLPEEEKFSLIGIDIEHQPILALQYLESLLQEVDKNALSETKLGQIGEVLRGELIIPNEQVGHFIQELLESLAQDSVRLLLDTNHAEFELVLSSLLDGIRLSAIQDPALWNNGRDAVMYRNFLKQCDLTGLEKYFGQWGLNHVYQGAQRDVNWAAGLINGEGTAYRGKVLSIAMIYQDSSFLQNHSYEVAPLNTYLTGTNVLRELAGSDLLLVKLDNAGSPFNEQLIWKVRDVKPQRGATVDYYQYILFVPGGEASSPLEANLAEAK